MNQVHEKRDRRRATHLYWLTWVGTAIAIVGAYFAYLQVTQPPATTPDGAVQQAPRLTDLGRQILGVWFSYDQSDHNAPDNFTRTVTIQARHMLPEDGSYSSLNTITFVDIWRGKTIRQSCLGAFQGKWRLNGRRLRITIAEAEVRQLSAETNGAAIDPATLPEEAKCTLYRTFIRNFSYEFDVTGVNSNSLKFINGSDGVPGTWHRREPKVD